jgi:hypothetical protein
MKIEVEEYEDRDYCDLGIVLIPENEREKREIKSLYYGDIIEHGCSLFVISGAPACEVLHLGIKKQESF